MSYHRRSSWGISLLYVALFIVAIAAEFRGAFLDDSKARRALETEGFTNATLLDHSYAFMTFRGGERSDAARFTFEATNPIGKRVTVYVFDGWPFKGATIRAL